MIKTVNNIFNCIFGWWFLLDVLQITKGALQITILSQYNLENYNFVHNIPFICQPILNYTDNHIFQRHGITYTIINGICKIGSKPLLQLPINNYNKTILSQFKLKFVDAYNMFPTLDNVNSIDQWIIKSYTKYGAELINSALRLHDGIINNEYKNAINALILANALDVVLQHSVLKQTQIVFRGTGLSINQFLKTIKNGYYIDPGFISTSCRIHNYEGVIMIIKLCVGTKCFAFNKNSYYPNEHEVLIDRYTPIKITNIIQSNSKYYAICETLIQ